jgi:type IV secretion system protein TrbL
VEDLGVIDQFTNTFSQYIDTGFGLLGGEVRYLTVTLIAIDMTLAGIFWAIESREAIPQLLRKILYVGTFAFILNNFNALASILFRSFAGLGLTATASGLTAANLFRPGQLAAVGVTAAHPLLTQMGDLGGFPRSLLEFRYCRHTFARLADRHYQLLHPGGADVRHVD